jgi:alpha-amylase
LKLTTKEWENVEADSLTFLRTVPYEYGFHFTTEGVYDGQTATSLEDFYDKIKQVPADSLCFHQNRGDFQRWIRNTIGDNFLANELSLFLQRNLSSEEIRTELLKLLDDRIRDLKGQRLI